MDLKTKEVSEIVSGKNYALLGGTDNYLYIGKKDDEVPAPVYDVYIYDMKTKKMKKFIDYAVMDLQVEKGIVLAMKVHFDTENYQFDILSESGERIFSDTGVTAFILHDNVYYAKIFYSGNDHVMDGYRYSLKKKTNGRITEKLYQKLEKKYFDSRN